MGTLFRPLVQARTWKETLHLLIDLPLGIAWFTIIVTGIALGAGLIPLMLIGLVVLFLTLQFVRVVSAIERARAKALLDADIANPFLPIGEIDGLVATNQGRARRRCAVEGRRSTASSPSPSASSRSPSQSRSGRSRSAGSRLRSGASSRAGRVRPTSTGGPTLGIIVGTFFGGLLFLIATPWVIHGLAVMDRGLIRGLLGADRNAQLQRRVTQLEVSKTASLDVAEAERTRIERDLHDGVQPRLVVAAMDLGLARERAAGSDPEVVALIERAQDETKQAIAELRELVRGIHPAVLTDRGLDAALSSLAARCPVPVTVQVNLDERPPTPVESAAYFIVAESLTNIAKHSDAKHARVNVNRDDSTLRVEITDDGKGGARTEPGGGLSGLADRVRSLEGTFRVASPVGGPTTILAELPCGS